MIKQSKGAGKARGDARPPAHGPACEDALPVADSAGEGERPREPLRRASSHAHLHERKKPASGVLIFRDHPTLVFLTVCTEHRRRWLAQSAVHDHLRAVWGDARAWMIGRYVLMPDHLHCFCAPGEPDIPLNRWVSYWKRLFTQRTRNLKWTWQAHQWDTRLRREENYDEKWDYVVRNPERAGLVPRAEDWPYQGELNEFRW